MQKENKQIILNTLAVVVRRHIPKGKAPSKLAMENGMSPSTISLLLRGKKNLEITTFIMIAEILEVNPGKLLNEFMNELPKDFTTLDI